MLRIYIFCIENSATGGIELLHQLCHSMNKNPGCEAIMYYCMPGRSNMDPVPEIYKHYDCPYVINTFLSPDDAETAFFIVPEVRTALFDGEGIFADCKHKCIYWESVDNYFLTVPEEYKMSFVNDKSILHLSQSEYSRQFLIKEGVSEEMILDVSDYLNKSYLENERPSDWIMERQNIVLYNPKKGFDFTRKIMDALRDVVFVPIVSMSPDQVRELMYKCKIYIDFGNHPGKDRIPREAAVSGLIVITGRNGSAANPVDVPIPEECKFENEEGSITAVADKIRECLTDFDECTKLYDAYRASIRREPELFEEQVRHAVEVMQIMAIAPVNLYVVGHKDFTCPESEEYIPIYTGEASDQYNGTDKLTDDGVESIARKNGLYHELTALYAVWKNHSCGKDHCFFGLNRYNRFLCTPDGSSLLNGFVCNVILSKYDVILPQKTVINASRADLFMFQYGKKEDLDTVRDILWKKHSGTVKYYERELKSNEGHYYNLFVMNKQTLDNYCEWLFGILSEFEERTKGAELSDGIMSHISEILLDVYIADRELSVAEVPLCNSEWS